jgi:hypothetical protein
MPHSSEPSRPISDAEGTSPQGNVVRLSLLQAAKRQEVEERAKEIAERISKLFRPPEMEGNEG